MWFEDILDPQENISGSAEPALAGRIGSQTHGGAIVDKLEQIDELCGYCCTGVDITLWY